MAIQKKTLPAKSEKMPQPEAQPKTGKPSTEVGNSDVVTPSFMPVHL